MSTYKHDKPTPIGDPQACLVSMWGGTHEATAQRFLCEDHMGRPEAYYRVTVMQSRGKAGKETYLVHGIKYAEDESFVLL